MMNKANAHALVTACRIWFSIALVALMLTAALRPAARAAQATSGDNAVRIGYQKGGGLMTLMKTQGLLDKTLTAMGYRVSWLEFPAGPQMLEALNAGAIDIATTGGPAPVFAQAGGYDFVYVGAEPGTVSGEAIVVPEHSPIRSVSQLKGKKVAFQRGSGSHFLLLAALQKAGLNAADVQPIYLTPADARAAFTSGSIDAWVVWDPYLAAAEDALKARLLADYRGLPQIANFYESSRGFAARAPQAVAALLAQAKATGIWANAHQAEVAGLIAAQTGLPGRVVEVWQRRVRFGTVPVSASIMQQQQTVADLFYQQKLIPKKIDVNTNVWHWQP